MNTPSSILRRRTSRAPLALLALLAGILGLSGCSRGRPLTTQAAGHTITAEIAGSHSFEADATRALFQSEFGKVTIERTRVRVGDVNWTEIPADVPVKVSIRRGRLRVSAGSVSIERKDSHP